MNARELLRRYNTASARHHELAATLPERVAAIEDSLVGYPASPSFEPGSRGVTATRHWCETHERENCDCGGGTTYPTLSDRTGEQALVGDRAAADLKALERAVLALERTARSVDAIVARYRTGRPATDDERRETARANERDESCESHARLEHRQGHPLWEPAKYRPTVNGTPTRLCSQCYRWLADTGELPPRDVLDRWSRGIRVAHPVKRPA